LLSAFGGSAAGWAAIVVTLTAAVTAVVLRRLRNAPPLVRRMRPHYVLGYAALTLAVVHVYFSMGAMRGEDSSGLWAATGALFALGAQTFVGASLQDPGGYRRSLRTWHLSILAALVVLLVWHVTANGALGR
jgi:predicted membrane channel-forming protein YqfA (hemolysin III family)